MYERHRFRANAEDYRPVIFPPPGPYWCSGYGEDHSIVVAYLPKGTDLKKYWPEATNIETEEKAEIVYTDRFPKPAWFGEERGRK